jgi:hypothetical protein
MGDEIYDAGIERSVFMLIPNPKHFIQKGLGVL